MTNRVLNLFFVGLCFMLSYFMPVKPGELLFGWDLSTHVLVAGFLTSVVILLSSTFKAYKI